MQLISLPTSLFTNKTNPKSSKTNRSSTTKNPFEVPTQIRVKNPKSRPKTDYFENWEAHVTHHLTTTHPKQYSKVTIAPPPPPPPTPPASIRRHRSSVLPAEILEEEEEDDVREGTESVSSLSVRKERRERMSYFDRSRSRERRSRYMDEKKDLCKVDTVSCDGEITPGCELTRMKEEIERVDGRPKLPSARRYGSGRDVLHHKFELDERMTLKLNMHDKRWSMGAVREEDGTKSIEYRTKYSRHSMVVPSVSRLVEEPARRSHSAQNSPRNSVHYGSSRRSVHSPSPSRNSIKDFSGRSVHSQSPRNSYPSPSSSSLKNPSRHSVHSPSRLSTQGLSRDFIETSYRQSAHGTSKLSNQYSHVPGYAIQTTYRDSIQVLTEQELVGARLATAGMSNSTKSSFEVPRRGKHIEYVSQFPPNPTVEHSRGKSPPGTRKISALSAIASSIGALFRLKKRSSSS